MTPNIPELSIVILSIVELRNQDIDETIDKVISTLNTVMLMYRFDLIMIDSDKLLQ